MFEHSSHIIYLLKGQLTFPVIAAAMSIYVYEGHVEQGRFLNLSKGDTPPPPSLKNSPLQKYISKKQIKRQLY